MHTFPLVVHVEVRCWPTGQAGPPNEQWQHGFRYGCAGAHGRQAGRRASVSSPPPQHLVLSVGLTPAVLMGAR